MKGNFLESCDAEYEGMATVTCHDQAQSNYVTVANLNAALFNSGQSTHSEQFSYALLCNFISLVPLHCVRLRDKSSLRHVAVKIKML